MKHVKFHLPSFLRRVRIHGEEFDSSARAMNRVKQVRLLQADLRIVRGSTNERKQMSTKTTFKRIALVAVAALGFGVLSVAPSNAAAQLDSLAVSLASTTQNTTETLTATASVLTATLAGTKGVDTLTVTASIVSGPAYVQPILAFSESTTAEIGGSGSVATVNTQNTSTVTQATGKFKVYLNAPTVVGTYVVKLTPTGGTNAVAVTVSITVSATPVAPVSATFSTIAMNATGCSAGPVWQYGVCYAAGGSGAGTYTYAVATDTVTATASLSTVATGIVDGSLIAGFLLDQKNAASNTMASTVPWTVAITSGPGKISMGSRNLSAKSVTESLATTGVDGYQAAGTTKSVYFVSDGASGVSVITFTAGGVLIGTRTITVVGSTIALVSGTPTKSVVGVGETASVTITGADVLGTTTGAASVYAFSSDATIATVNSGAASTVVITGVKSGTATITVGNAATIATSTITKTLAIKVGAVTAKTVSFSVSPTTPQPGELVTLIVTAVDASGNPVGDGSRALFSSTGIATGLAVQGSTLPTTANATLVGGSASYTFYAPTGSGELTLTATQGVALDNVVADATTAAKITSTISITNAALDGATDAANDALDASNAATEAALSAAEAADAATTAAQEASDAVAALSESVTQLIAALQAQIKSLTKVVNKIAKKVKA